MASSSSDHGHRSYKYNVFMSFRGPDTRNNFVSHLYDALRRKKIEAYKDDPSLPKGAEISSTLIEAIENSKISIVVLSRDYATSAWCLEELVHILKFKHERDHIVLPVFYGINPLDVSELKEIYSSAFVKHEGRFKDETEKVLSWRSALEEIGNLSGWDSRQYRSESELVDVIAHDILSKLCISSSTSVDELCKNLVGMDRRVKIFESLFRIDSLDVLSIGIGGMGGIGKSTLAQVVLKRFSSRFDSCFFVDVSDEVKRRGLLELKEKLHASLLKDKDVNMNNSFNDVRLRRTKVLVVLDNVDDEEHIEQLIGVREEIKTRYGEGSRIIITSRDEKLLKESVDDIYKVGALDSDEATALFYLNAFGRDSSKKTDYIELSKRIVDYAEGNPLALKVLGSHLHSRCVKDWESAVRKLRNTPFDKVQKVLKISYDALDHVQQSIFLDIACFLEGESRETVEDILEEESSIGISVLVEKSLLTVVEGNRIRMHDLIREMAWEIVRQESKEPGQRSRLWNPEEIYSVLKRNKGSARIEGISLDLSKISSDLCLNPTVFEAMENLRLLEIYDSQQKYQTSLYFLEGLDYLPDSLRYLHWEKYPLKSLPSAFGPRNMAKLDMRYSKLEKLWNEVQRLPNLKHIDLCFSEDLIELPDLSKAPTLKVLKVSHCKSLCRLPKISGNLQHLVMDFTGVEVFDPSIESAENLEIVDLSGSERLTRLPMLPRNLRKLYLEDCKAILFDLTWSVFLGLHSLTELRMSDCCISDIPEAFNLSSLETLDIRENDFERIPSSIKQMNKLKHLNISECKNLKSLLDLPPSLQSLAATGCESLRMISVCGLTSLEWIDASECKALEEFIIDENACMPLEATSQSFRSPIRFLFHNCLKLKQGSQDNICTLFQRQTFKTAFTYGFDLKRLHPRFTIHPNYACYSGNEIPKWFTYQSEGSSIQISLGHNFIGIAASIVSEFDSSNIYSIVAQFLLKTSRGEIDITKGHFSSSYRFNPEVVSSRVHLWHSFFNSVEKELLDSVTEASFEFKMTDGHSRAEIKIKKIGIRLMYLEEFEDCNFSSLKADQTSPKPDETPYPPRRFKQKCEDYETGATTSYQLMPKKLRQRRMWSQEMVDQAHKQQRLYANISANRVPIVYDKILDGLRPLAHYANNNMLSNNNVIAVRPHSEIALVEIYISYTDIYELANGLELSLPCVSAYMSCLKMKDIQRRNPPPWGFIYPAYASPVTVDGRSNLPERVKAVCDIVRDAPKGKMFLMPYNIHYHWLLVLLNPWDDEALIFNSVKAKREDDLTNLISRVFDDFKSRNTGVGKQNPSPTRIKNQNCPKQIGGTECGYFTIRYMCDIVDFGITKVISTPSYYEDDLDVVKSELGHYISQFIRYT